MVAAAQSERMGASERQRARAAWTAVGRHVHVTSHGSGRSGVSERRRARVPRY